MVRIPLEYNKVTGRKKLKIQDCEAERQKYSTKLDKQFLTFVNYTGCPRAADTTGVAA